MDGLEMTKTGYPDAVLVSDLHLTDKTPVSRIDDYIQAQKDKLEAIQRLARTPWGHIHGDCPVLCAGDVFDHWKASPWLLRMAFEHLPRPFITIPGQHDLPMHSLEQFGKSALALLDTIGGGVQVLCGEYTETDKLLIMGCPFGTLDDLDPVADLPKTDKRKILLLHELTWKGKRPTWSKSGWTDKELLDRFGEHFDVIVSGDNHTGFVTKRGGTILVNPGSMMRMNVDQEDHQPRCYRYYADENRVEAVDIPVEMGVHDRSRLNEREAHDERVAAYIARMNENWQATLSFTMNLENYFQENTVPQQVRKLIYEALDKPSG